MNKLETTHFKLYLKFHVKVVKFYKNNLNLKLNRKQWKYWINYNEIINKNIFIIKMGNG